MAKDELTKAVEKVNKSNQAIEKALSDQKKQNDKILSVLKDQAKLDEKLVKMISKQEQINKDTYEVIDQLRKNAEEDSKRQSFRYRVDVILAIITIIIGAVAAYASVFSAMHLK